MLFTSLIFFVFFAIVIIIYYSAAKRLQNHVLLVASYVFYGWWDWRILFLLILTSVMQFWCALLLEKGRLTSSEMKLPAAVVCFSSILLLGCDVTVLIATFTGGAGASDIITPLMPTVIVGIAVTAIALPLVYHHVVALREEVQRKAIIFFAVGFQLCILAFFKYFNFFVENAHALTASLGYDGDLRYLDIILPVGISFYTFQVIGYTIDVYRREFPATTRFLDFCVFTSFFPVILAGPIERARNLLPQLGRARVATPEQVQRGCFLIFLGLFKKIAIADGLVGTVDAIFATQGTLTWADAVVGTFLFTIQLYADFSGYSDMARGVAKLLGIEVMVNFRQPYFSKSPREFWQRWHISLSTWLGDYLYRPLGGNNGTVAFTLRNLMLTMVLGGLWHGAAWNFVLWGFYNGLLIAVQRILYLRRGSRPIRSTWVTLPLMFAGNFILILYGRLLFRAESLGQIGEFTRIFITGAGGLDYGAGIPSISAVFGVVLLFFWELIQYRKGGDARFYRTMQPAFLGMATAGMAALTLMGLSNEPAQFIYFRF